MSSVNLRINVIGLMVRTRPGLQKIRTACSALLALLIALHSSCPASVRSEGVRFPTAAVPLPAVFWFRIRSWHNLLSCFLFAVRETETFLGVQHPEKYSRQGRSIQRMQENGLRLWICDFSLFFVGEPHN